VRRFVTMAGKHDEPPFDMADSTFKEESLVEVVICHVSRFFAPPSLGPASLRRSVARAGRIGICHYRRGNRVDWLAVTRVEHNLRLP